MFQQPGCYTDKILPSSADIKCPQSNFACSWHRNRTFWAVEMAQQLKILAIGPDDMDSIWVTHMVEGDNQTLSVDPWPLPTGAHEHEYNSHTK